MDRRQTIRRVVFFAAPAIERRKLGAAGRRAADGRPSINDLRHMNALSFALMMDRLDRRQAAERRIYAAEVYAFPWSLRRFRWLNRRAPNPRRTGIPEHPNCRCSMVQKYGTQDYYDESMEGF
jgi:hypothetical protein